MKRVAFALVWACLGPAYATSFEDIQRIKATEGIPRWREAAEHARALRADPPTDAVATAWTALDAQTDLTGASVSGDLIDALGAKYDHQ